MFGLVSLLLLLKNFHLKIFSSILFILFKNGGMKSDLAGKYNDRTIASKRVLVLHCQQIFQLETLSLVTTKLIPLCSKLFHLLQSFLLNQKQSTLSLNTKF